MATRLILCVGMIAVYIAMTTAQPRNRPMRGRGTPSDWPPSDWPPLDWHPSGPCRLTDGNGVELEKMDCPDGRTCTVGPVDLYTRGTTTVKAYFCTRSVLPSMFGPCRIENEGVVIDEEEMCPHGATCDVGPLYYKDGDAMLSAFYCRHDPGAHLCGIKAPDGRAAGVRDCASEFVCDMDNAVNTYDNNYSAYGCRRPKAPPDVCRVEDSAGVIVDEQPCSDGSQCGTEGFKFVNDRTTYTNFYCPGNNDWTPPYGDGCCGMSGGRRGNGPRSGCGGRSGRGGYGGRFDGGPSGHHSNHRGRSGSRSSGQRRSMHNRGGNRG